jgi:hypothetical protein
MIRPERLQDKLLILSMVILILDNKYRFTVWRFVVQLQRD